MFDIADTAMRKKYNELLDRLDVAERTNKKFGELVIEILNALHSRVADIEDYLEIEGMDVSANTNVEKIKPEIERLGNIIKLNFGEKND